MNWYVFHFRLVVQMERKKERRGEANGSIFATFVAKQLKIYNDFCNPSSFQVCKCGLNIIMFSN